MLRRVAWPSRNTLAAEQQWQHPTLARPTVPDGKVEDALRQIQTELSRAPLMTPAEHQAWSRDAAGLAAQAAQHTTDPDDQHRLRTLARDLGRWSGPAAPTTAHHGANPARVIARALAGGSQEGAAVMESVTALAQLAAMHQVT